MQAAEPPVLRSLGEGIAQGLSAVMTLGSVLYLSWVWTELPARVPIHFGFNGQPDRFADAHGFWLLAAVGLLTFVGLTLLERVPHVFNYPFRVTAQNRTAAYRFGRRVVLGTKTSIAAVFAYVTIAAVQTAVGRTNGLGTWFVPIVLGGLVVGIGTCMVQFSRLRRFN